MPWLRHFALFLVFVAALFRPAAAGAFVSARDAGTQARVGAFDLVAATLVGPASTATSGVHEGIGAAYDGNASGYRFAAGGAGTVKKASVELSKEAQRAIRSLEKQITKHEQKLADFRANPTVRPGMEDLPKEVIERQQQVRIQHLETEIQTFKSNIEKIRNEGQ